MASTTFVDFITPVPASWLNDVNYTTYGVATIAALRLVPNPNGTVKILVANGAATYFYDSTDVTSSDNGSTLIVSSAGGRWKLIAATGVYPEIYGAKGDGVTDDTTAVQAAITAVAAQTGPQYGDSMGQSPYGYGDSRRLKLSGKKYLINNTLTLSGDIGIYAEGGGFLAGSSFPAASYMVDTGANPYGGRINDLTLDGNDRNVKGIRIQNAHLTRWTNLSVVSCRNDSIVYEAGAEFILSGFEVSGSATPNALTVAGLRVLGSDGHFTNGVVKYTPIGVYNSSGGNNEFVNIHAWGLYAAFKQYVSFWSVNAVRNVYVGCYADSPAKQDYAQGNLVVLNAIPNGGIGFYFDSSSTQSQLIGCRGYVNTTAYAAAGLPGTNQFYAVYSAAQFTQVTGLTYNYAGNWLGDVLFDSNTTRDASLLVGTPTAANGFRPAVLAQVADSGGGTTGFIVQNSNSAFATSEARITLKVGTSTDTAAIGGVFGSTGASYMYGNVLGTEHWRYSALKYTYTGANSAEGDQSAVWNDGVGSFSMMALYRNNGGGVPNAANAAAKFGNINSNSRSINAAGTINASGADYAEYMHKNLTCGEISKGQVVGVDVDGFLTDVWEKAHSFVVKSTDPSYVGGDTWGSNLDGDELEQARQRVDRIAFCGQVPCIVDGTVSVGDFIVPEKRNVSIVAIAVTNPSFDQYKNSVGKVWAIKDGKAWISVKVS